MTAQCGGGTSSPITGVVNNLVLATGAAGIFSLIPGLEWLVAIGSALGVLTYDLTTICSTDPPSMPTFTSAEILAFTTGAIGSTDFNNFIQKAHDIAAIIVWGKYCKCDNGTVPAAPSYPTQPPATIQLPSNSNTCGSGAFQGLVAFDNAGSTDMHIALPSAGLGGLVTQGGVANVQTVRIPTGVTNIQTRLRVDPSDINSTEGANVVLGFWSNTAVISTSCLNCSTSAVNADLVQNFTPPGGAVFYTLIGDTNHLNNSTTKHANITVTNTCGGTVGAAVNPCPSDPAVLALLNQILQLLTLMQRQNVPFAYVAGAVHSGLSGSGTLTVPQLVGMKIELTTISTVAGLEVATPDELFNAGWISWGTVDGFEQREWISKSPMLTFPQNAQILDRFSYNLRPGMVATFTELEREA